MRNIYVIAKNTFREAIRDRILYAILGFGLVFILLDLFIAGLSLGDWVMIKSFGLAGIYIFGLIITIFLGSSIIYKEIERRTLYFVLSKPVSRRDLILGKFSGLFAAISLTTILMAAVYAALILYVGGGFDYGGLLAVLFQILEQALFVAVLIFFSSVAAPLTATLCGTMILFVGHLLTPVLANAKQIGGLIYKFILFLYYIFPNLEKFNLRNSVVHQIIPSFESILLIIGYALLYSVILLVAANILFGKREL